MSPLAHTHTHTHTPELMAMSRCVEEDFAAIAEMKKSEEMEEELFQVRSTFVSLPSGIVVYHHVLGLHSIQSQHGVRPVSQVCAGLWKEMESYHKYNSQAVSCLATP